MPQQKPSSKGDGDAGPDERADAATDATGAVDEDRLAQLLRLIQGPVDLVVLTRERLQAAIDDAVKRGRMTRADGAALASDLLSQGWRRTEDVLADLEQLLGRSRDRPSEQSERVAREVDRARRAVGAGPGFPIDDYDGLTAAEIVTRLAGLSPADLRKLRDYERRNANRKTVLRAVESELR